MTLALPLARQRLPILLLVVLALVTACTTIPPTAPSFVAVASPTQPPPTPAVTDSVAPETGAPTTTTPVPPTPIAPVPTAWLPDWSPLPPTLLPEPTATPVPPTEPPGTLPPTGGQVAAGDSPPTRVVVRGLGIDMPVMKGNSAYPYCNVAQYMTNFVNPGQPGTTYMYGHARTGMFLPFLTHSKVNDGASMIGLRVDLYTADKKLHVYRINIVKRHVRDFSLATELDPGEHRLIMQTSEGPSGLYPKLQIAARPIAVYRSTAAEALPTPRPKICG